MSAENKNIAAEQTDVKAKKLDAFEEIRKLWLASQGEGIGDDVFRQNIIREAIYKEASLISVGLKVVGTRYFSNPDIKMAFPSDITGEYPIPDEGQAEIQGPVTWSTWNTEMQMGQVRYRITDWAKIRQLQNYQVEFSRRKASEAMADLIDQEIIDVLYAGCTNTVAAATDWDAATAAVDIEKDIVGAWQNVLANSNCTLDEMKNCFLIVPADVYAEPLKLQLIGNVQQRMADYLKTGFGLDIYPTRDYSAAGTTGIQDDAVFGIRGQRTAMHAVLRTNAVPLVEKKRVTNADEWSIKRIWKTRVVPDSTDGTTTKRLVKITGVT